MFLSPLFLYAAALGASVPLLLHLMQSRRKVQLLFPTLRFLRLAEKHSSRKIRLENFLLWFLRTLIMALLGLAFAMPMIRRSGLAFLGDAPRDVAIVLDASYSMNYHTGRGTVWDKAIEAASAIIDGLGDKDRFCIYLARAQPEPLIAAPISNKPEGLNRLKALPPGPGSSRLAPAVEAALKALRKADQRRERELHILTDNQALPWQSWAADKVEIDKATAVFVSLLGVPAPENTGIASVELQPPVVRQGSDVKITAKLLHNGSATDTAATLFIDEKEAGRRIVKAGDPASATPSFNLPPLDPGLHPARLQTPDDNLPIDNAFHFLIRVQDRMPTLVVGQGNDTLFVRTALHTDLGHSGAVVEATPEHFAEKPLSPYASLFLCNALPLSGQAIAAVEDYVKTGGLLVVFPGLRATPEAWQAWNCLPGIPTGIEDLPLAQRNRTLTWDQPQHLLVRALRQGAGVPTLAVRRRLVWSKLAEPTQRLVSLGPDQPFLLERPFGEGRVLMFAVAADRTWSDFPLSPFYLPLLVQCADYSAGVGAKSPFVWATDSLSLTDRFPELKGKPTLLGPEGEPVSLRSAVVEGRTVLNAENLTAPGIYTLSTSEQPEPRPALAVNLPREESDLTPIAQDDLLKRLGHDHARIATDLAMLRQQIQEHRIGRTYGEHLLWLAFVLTVIEFSYANLLARGQQTLGGKVRVDAAGHVETRPTAEIA